MKRSARILFVVVFLICGLYLFSGTSHAGSVIRDLQDICTTPNCLSSIIRGTYQSNGFGDADPFVVQILSIGAECVRLDMVAQGGVNMQMVLVSPSGRIWANDNRSLLDTRPLIKAITDVQGWYTLHISSFNGGIVEADFALRYGRYLEPNPNCNLPTPSF